MTPPTWHAVGLDPGVNTGVVVLEKAEGELPTIVAAQTMRLPPKGRDLRVIHAQVAEAVRDVFGNLIEPHVVIEDQLTGGAYRRSGGHRQHPVSIALQNAIAALLVGTVAAATSRYKLIPPQRWYPRLRGRMLTKAAARAMFEREVETRRVLTTGPLPHNEHEWMAFGLALTAYRWAQTEHALLNRDRLVRALQGVPRPDAPLEE